MSRGAPVELTTFIGRRRELAEGRRMLRAAPLVTLVGPGGVGKTRLAQRLAHQVGRRFPEGVVWVELAAQRDPASVVGQVAAALGVDPQGQPVEEALTTYLHPRQLLIVLDNCEHLVETCARLSTLLLGASTEMRILATSREPLRVASEHVMGVEPLEVPTLEEAAAGKVAHVDAVALLTDRVRAIDPGFQVDASNAEAVGRLSRRLDGIPLAIELAAPRLRVLSLQQIIDRLDVRFDLLTTGSRTALPRHQTLRGLVDWSHDLCSPAEQALWARMSVFDGGADLSAVESVGGDLGASTSELLAALADKSVLTISETDGRLRYQMLETIREYGAERLAQRDETALLRDRHLAHYLGFARRARASWVGPDQVEWLTRVSADLGNLRAAFEHALAMAAGPSGAMELVTSLVWYWSPAGSPDEGAAWFSRALAVPGEQSPLLLHTLAAAAILAGDRSDVDTALTVARRAVSLPHREDQPVDRAAHEIAAATEALVTGDLSAAEAAYRRALTDYQAADDLYGQLEAFAMVGILTGRLGRTDEALSVFNQGKRLCDAHGEVIMRGQLLDYTGDLLMHAGRPEEALVDLRECLEAWTLLRPHALCSSLGQVARIYANQGRQHWAASLYGAQDRIWDDHGLLHGPFDSDDLAAATRAMLVEALGDEEYRTAFDEGYAMRRYDAVKLALGRAPAIGAQGVDDSYPATLSKRESQVAALLVRGLSNKEIAEELVVSPRTAEGHVAKVMDKLGVHSRDEVAARLPPPLGPGQE